MPKRTCDDWGWSDPGTSSRHPLFGGPPAAGRQRVFVGNSACVDACSPDCGWSLAIARVKRTGEVSRRGKGRTCRTPPSATPSSQSVSAWLARNWTASCNSGCGTYVVDCSRPLGAAVQRRPRKYSKLDPGSWCTAARIPDRTRMG